MTVTDKAVEAAARAIYEQNPCGEQDFDADFRPTGTGYVIKFDALPEYDAGLYELSLNQARAALEAAAPHMLPAPEEVSEAEKRLATLAEVLPGWSNARPAIARAHYTRLGSDIETLLSALSSKRERAERAERERDDAIARWCLRMADVREASGVGVKPMLDEVPGAIKARIDAIEAKVKQAERLIAKARTLSDTLKAYGYPVSAAHWANASGQMSVQARALHLAAESLIEGLAALRWTEEASQGEGE